VPEEEEGKRRPSLASAVSRRIPRWRARSPRRWGPSLASRVRARGHGLAWAAASEPAAAEAESESRGSRGGKRGAVGGIETGRRRGGGMCY
jgi:hypothetical protein